jgi:hypothetical protein
MDRCFRNISPPKDSRSCNYTENPREVTLALFPIYTTAPGTRSIFYRNHFTSLHGSASTPSVLTALRCEREELGESSEAESPASA